jgi:hypothetical protein
MIELDIAALSRDELTDRVSNLCVQCGSVVHVGIVKDGGRHGFALAAVEMATPAETFEVVRRFGGSKAHGMALIRIEQVRKPHRILVAGVPETYNRLFTILAGYTPHFADTFANAQARLKKTMYHLVMIGIHFDESRMFDLLRQLKASDEYAPVPVVCYRATLGAETQTKLTMQAVEIACGALGAAGFLDLLEFSDDEAANIALRKLVEQTLERYPETAANSLQ